MHRLMWRTVCAHCAQQLFPGLIQEDTSVLTGCCALQVRAKQEEWDRQAAEVARLHATTPDQLYHADLDAFEAALDERDEEDAKEAELLVSQRGRAGRAGGAKVCYSDPMAGIAASTNYALC